MEKFEMKEGETAEFPDGTVLKAVLRRGTCSGCAFECQCEEKARRSLSSVLRLMGPCLDFDRKAKDCIKFVSVAAQKTRKAYVPFRSAVEFLAEAAKHKYMVDVHADGEWVPGRVQGVNVHRGYCTPDAVIKDERGVEHNFLCTSSLMQDRVRWSGTKGPAGRKVSAREPAPVISLDLPAGGEIRFSSGRKVEIAEHEGCEGCMFHSSGGCLGLLACSGGARKDRQNVIFREAAPVKKHESGSLIAEFVAQAEAHGWAVRIPYAVSCTRQLGPAVCVAPVPSDLVRMYILNMYTPAGRQEALDRADGYGFLLNNMLPEAEQKDCPLCIIRSLRDLCRYGFWDDTGERISLKGESSEWKM